MGSFAALLEDDPSALLDLLGLVTFFDGSLSDLFGSVGRVLGSTAETA